MIPRCMKCNKKFSLLDFNEEKKLFHCTECNIDGTGWNYLADDWYNKTYDYGVGEKEFETKY